MIWAIVVVLVVIWLLGLVANVVGSLIHVVLILAIIVIAYQLLTGRRRI